MHYRKVAISTIIIFTLCVMLIAYFCFLAFSGSYEYDADSVKRKNNAGVISEKNTFTVIIDPGHGGIDPGAVVGEVLEKDLNLAISLKLYDFLRISGYDVVLTRIDDNLLGDGSDVKSKKIADLKSRLQIMENTENCIFVSIHINKFEKATVCGLQTFYSSGNVLSEALANSIQKAAKSLDIKNDREIKLDNGNIYLLKNATKPAVLVECGFLSNQYDKSKLTDDAYQASLAFTLYEGIIEFLGDFR